MLCTYYLLNTNIFIYTLKVFTHERRSLSGRLDGPSCCLSLFFPGQVLWRHNRSVSLFCLFSSPAQEEQTQRERAHRLREPEVKGQPFNGEVQTLLKANRSAKVSLMPSRNVPIKTALPHAKPHIKEHNKYLIRLIDAEPCIYSTWARRLMNARHIR